MRTRSLLAAAVAVLVSLGGVAITSAPVAAAAPPVCPWANSSLHYCNRYPYDGPRGSIALLGDSVLLGSADGASNPGLPSMLNARGFGPVNLIATVGMKTKWSTSEASASYWISRWRSSGFTPDYIALNLGANHLGTCTLANPAPCKAAIDQLLDEIALQFPNATVWWPKIVQNNLSTGGLTTAAMGWNAALDQAASQRTNLVVWDWPTALLTASPPIVTDVGGIHPVSGKEYVKRSTLMADQLAVMMPAHYTGPRITPPSLVEPAMGFTPVAATTVYDTSLPDVPNLQAGVDRDIDLGAVAPGAGGVALTVTGRNAAAGGFLRLFACGDPQPATSNLNFQPGVVRTAQALVKLSATQHLCAYSNVDVDITIALQGTFAVGAGDTFAPMFPERLVDTRNTGRAPLLTVPVPAADGVAVSFVVVGESGGGTVTVYECGTTPPTAPSLSFVANEVVAGAAFVPVSPAATVCVQVDTADDRLVDVVVDVTGTFTSDPGGLRFSPVPGTRLLDTRSAVGGWYGRHGRFQNLNVITAPAGTEAVSGTVTMVRPLSGSHLRAYGCGPQLPPTSVVNAQPGLAAANNVTAGVDPGLPLLCIWASQNTDSLFDVMGYWVRGAG